MAWQVRGPQGDQLFATRQLEREHGLTVTPGLEDIDVIDNKRNPTKREIEKADRSGEAPPARLRLSGDRLDIDSMLMIPRDRSSCGKRLWIACETCALQLRAEGDVTGWDSTASMRSR